MVKLQKAAKTFDPVPKHKFVLCRLGLQIRSEYMSRIPRHVSSRVYVSHSETCKQPSVDLVHISECEIHGGR